MLFFLSVGSCDARDFPMPSSPDRSRSRRSSRSNAAVSAAALFIIGLLVFSLFATVSAGDQRKRSKLVVLCSNSHMLGMLVTRPYVLYLPKPLLPNKCPMCYLQSLPTKTKAPHKMTTTTSKEAGKRARIDDVAQAPPAAPIVPAIPNATGNPQQFMLLMQQMMAMVSYGTAAAYWESLGNHLLARASCL